MLPISYPGPVPGVLLKEKWWYVQIAAFSLLVLKLEGGEFKEGKG